MSAKPVIFVFGSNLKGIHGAGSARHAEMQFGAVRGVGVGRTGNAYAIPTKESPWGAVLTLGEIGRHVAEFVEYAAAHPELHFDVVAVGCGLAGYNGHLIAPLFSGAPENVNLPTGWRSLAQQAAQ